MCLYFFTLRRRNFKSIRLTRNPNKYKFINELLCLTKSFFGLHDMVYRIIASPHTISPNIFTISAEFLFSWHSGTGKLCEAER